MTPLLEVDIKNYYVVCLDIMGFESILKHGDYKIANIAYRDFEHTVKKVITYKCINETTCFIVIGDSLYFICEQLETALYVVRSFGIRCINTARALFKGRLKYKTPFMIRGGISFGPILLYSPNADSDAFILEQSYYPFNAIGLPIKRAYLLSEKPKGIRVAIDKESVNIEDYRKYFYKRYDLCKGDRYCEFLWPLWIFEEQKKRYIQESLEAFWDLYEKNRGKKHEKHYSSTLALLWKSIDKIPKCLVSCQFN